jgi:hypothetical protein
MNFEYVIWIRISDLNGHPGKEAIISAVLWPKSPDARDRNRRSSSFHFVRVR